MIVTHPRFCRVLAVGALFVAASAPALAGDADVIDVRTARSGSAIYDFAITVRSRDTGWDRYADRLEALGPDGTVLGARTLVHPHDDEQPFTRTLDGVKIPGAMNITLRAHFKPSGFVGTTRTVAIPGDVP